MRIFSHIAEFDFLGYHQLPAMVVFAEKVTLWAPSARQMAAARSTVTPDGLLELVQAKKVQVLGRRDWLTREETRLESGWEFARWSEVGYDDKVREIALIEEKAKIEGERRQVRFAPREEGEDWAANQIASDAPVVSAVRAAIQARSFPPGMLQKAERAAKTHPTDPDAPVRALLRDMRNHEDALGLIPGGIPVEPCQHPNVVPTIMARTDQRRPGTGAAPDPDKLWDLLNLATNLAAPRSIDDLLKLLERDDLDQLRDEIDPLLCASDAATDVAEELETEIRIGTDRTSWREALTPGTLLDRSLVGGGIGVAVADLIFEVVAHQVGPPGVGGLLTATGGLIAAGPPALGAARKLSWIGTTDQQYTGPKWPFVLAYDSEHPRYKAIDSLIQRISDYRRSRVRVPRSLSE